MTEGPAHIGIPKRTNGRKAHRAVGIWGNAHKPIFINRRVYRVLVSSILPHPFVYKSAGTVKVLPPVRIRWSQWKFLELLVAVLNHGLSRQSVLLKEHRKPGMKIQLVNNRSLAEKPRLCKNARWWNNELQGRGGMSIVHLHYYAGSSEQHPAL